MTGCHCKVSTHAHHRGRPCENIGTEPDGRCRACSTLTTKDGAGLLLDAFANLRRTWDELIGLQPDIAAASGTLTEADLELLSQHLSAHREAAAAFAREVQARRVRNL
jgi:hypothetical protein